MVTVLDNLINSKKSMWTSYEIGAFMDFYCEGRESVAFNISYPVVRWNEEMLRGKYFKSEDDPFGVDKDWNKDGAEGVLSGFAHCFLFHTLCSSRSGLDELLTLSRAKVEFGVFYQTDLDLGESEG